MYCPFCGTDNQEERQFCLACGTPLKGGENSSPDKIEKKTDLKLKIVKKEPEKIEKKDPVSVKQEEIIPKNTKAKKKINRGEKLSFSRDPSVSEKTKDASTEKDKKDSHHKINRRVIKKTQDNETLLSGKELYKVVPAEEGKQIKNDAQIISKKDKHSIVRESAPLDDKTSKDKSNLSDQSKLYKKSNDVKKKDKTSPRINKNKSKEEEILEDFTPDKMDVKELEESNLFHKEDSREGEREDKIGLNKEEDSDKGDMESEVNPKKVKHLLKANELERGPVLSKEQKEDSEESKVISEPLLEKEEEQKTEDSEIQIEEVPKDNFEDQQVLHRGVILGEEDTFDDQEGRIMGLSKNSFRIMIIMIIFWLILVIGGSVAYLSTHSDSSELERPSSTTAVLNDVSKLKSKENEKDLLVSWVPNTNTVRIVEYILELYNVKEEEMLDRISIPPDQYSYTITNLERGVKYRIVLKVRSDAGIESGGKNIFVSLEKDYDQVRKRDFQEIKIALEKYKKFKGIYPKSKNYASLLNTLFKAKLIKRRIQDPEYPEHEYIYKSKWEGQNYDFKIYLSNPKDELFGGSTLSEQVYTYSPLQDRSDIDLLWAEN